METSGEVSIIYRQQYDFHADYHAAYDSCFSFTLYRLMFTRPHAFSIYLLPGVIETKRRDGREPAL